jgi:hypothetical protein
MIRHEACRTSGWYFANYGSQTPESVQQVVACHVWYQEVTEILLPAERHCIAARLCAQACRAAATAADGLF